MGGVSIKGIQKTSLIDFPPYITSTIFLGGCNFKCPFCYNKEIVLNTAEEIAEEEVLGFLENRKNLLDAVCVTGGEPTMHIGLPEFIRKLKNLGLKVKIDTNGSNPNALKALIKENLVDCVAIDIKSDKKGYNKATDVDFDVGNVKNCVDMLREKDVKHELRTTVVPGFFDEQTAEEIGRWVGGESRYYLQQFVPENTLDKSCQEKKPYSIEKLKEFKGLMEQYFKSVEIRGI